MLAWRCKESILQSSRMQLEQPDSIVATDTIVHFTIALRTVHL